MSTISSTSVSTSVVHVRQVRAASVALGSPTEVISEEHLDTIFAVEVLLNEYCRLNQRKRSQLYILRYISDEGKSEPYDKRLFVESSMQPYSDKTVLPKSLHKPQSFNAIVQLISSALDALVCIHHMGLVHRNICPASICLFEQVVTKQLEDVDMKEAEERGIRVDLGTSEDSPKEYKCKLGGLEYCGQPDNKELNARFQQHVAKLSPTEQYYIAPERQSTPAHDIWSLGMIATHMLLSLQLFPSRTQTQTHDDLDKKEHHEHVLRSLHKLQQQRTSSSKRSKFIRLVCDMISWDAKQRPTALQAMMTLEGKTTSREKPNCLLRCFNCLCCCYCD